MPETMLLSGASDSSFRIDDLSMGPGLGLITGVIIDSHFAERGRIGRLLGAVTYNPEHIGLGIDEDTAIIVRQQQFEVIGSGAVYVVDGTKVTFSSLPQDKKSDDSKIASIGDICLHVLAAGDTYDFATRQPQFADQAVA
jgi:cyanophycinase